MNKRKTYIYNLDQVAIQEIRIKVEPNRGKQTVLKKLMIKYKSISNYKTCFIYDQKSKISLKQKSK